MVKGARLLSESDQKSHQGSNPCLSASFVFIGDVAQLGERLPCKQRVVGSKPIVSTNRTDFVC